MRATPVAFIVCILSFYATANSESSRRTARASKETPATHRPSLHLTGRSGRKVAGNLKVSLLPEQTGNLVLNLGGGKGTKAKQGAQ